MSRKIESGSQKCRWYASWGGRLVMVHLGNESGTGFQAGICDPGAIDREMLFISRHYAGSR